MDTLARILPIAAPEQCSGRVTDVAEGRITVTVHGASVACARAASCLLEPVAGDRVVLYREGAEAWVLAVLERPAQTASDVVLDGDATVRSRDGAVTLSAPGGVRLESPEEVRAVTGRFRLVSQRAELAVAKILATGRAIEAEVQQIRTHATRVDQVIGHLTQHVRTALRHVDDLDLVRAGRVDYRAEQTMALHGESAVVTARDVAKVDGGQIQLG